jgi:uncharacterized protein (TIGR02271 family)
MQGYGVREGMVVFSSDGHKLGKVVSRGAGLFTIEKGLIFKSDIEARDDEIARLEGDEIWLATPRDEVLRRGALEPERGTELPREPAAPIGASAASGAASMGARAAGVTQETRVPLVEEELEVEKRAQKVGEVRVRKEVHTEEQQVSVPVTREEVHVERVPVGEERTGEAAFAEGEVTIPITEEEIEIRKRPVVREEVRVSKSAVEEQQMASASVRREEAKIDTEGEVEERQAGESRRPYEEDPLTRK